MLAIKSAIVEEETGMLDGGKFKLNIEFESLSERWKREEGSIAEASGLQLAEVIVEWALGAVLADESALDEGSA